MRKINLSNESKRDAEVAFGTTFHRPTPVYKTTDGKRGLSQRSVRATLDTSDGALTDKFGDKLAEALLQSDPEVDLELFGRLVEGVKKIYLTADGKVAYVSP